MVLFVLRQRMLFFWLQKYKRYYQSRILYIMRVFLFLLLMAMMQPALMLRAQDSLRHIQQQTLVFWNLENAFWPADDSLTQDDDFTPEGLRQWSLGRLKQKLTQAERALLGAGRGLPPMVVGLAEIEGDSVMQYWTHRTSLYQLGYRYLLTDQRDPRGIQPALLYLPTEFRLLSHASYSIDLPEGQHATRQLLHASGRLVNSDTLDLIVCHLPSRYGGAKQSEPARRAAHRRLMALADSIAQEREHPHLVIMGDMNEAPSRRHPWWDTPSSLGWQNLMLPLQRSLSKHPSAYGSHKYQGEWSFLDQFIVNGQLVDDHGDTGSLVDAHGDKDSSARVASPSVQVSNARSFSLPFMLTPDASHLGQRPLRSYQGVQYEGGISDHLPIVLDLQIRF